MNIGSRTKISLAGFSVILAVVLLVLAIANQRHHQIYSGQVELNIAPANARVTINDQVIHGGNVSVRPGSQTIVVSDSGFTSQTKSIQVAKNQTVSVTIALLSDSTTTQNWYSTHSSDQRVLEQITGDQNVQQSEQAVKDVPLIKLLPFIGSGFEYRIDSGEPLPGTDVPGIYITSFTQQGQQDALDWIQSQGFNPSTLHIKYITGSVD